MSPVGTAHAVLGVVGNRNTRARVLLGAPLAVAVGTLAACAARRWAWREVTLGDLLGRSGGPSSVALAVSDAGAIVGTAAGRPFRWQGGEWRWLLSHGAGGACGVDDYGEAVGWLCMPQRGRTRPAHWRHDAVRVLELPPHGVSGRAEAIGPSGLVVGTVVRVDGTTVATTWRGDEVLTLPSPRDSRSTEAHAVAGPWIAGASRDGVGRRHACLWHEGRLVELDHAGTGESVARGVNRHGVTVGEVVDTSRRRRACRWTDGRVRILPTLGGTSGVARDVNDHGLIVGEATTTDDFSHAAAWLSGEIRDLGTLGGPTSVAHGVNDAGTVVGIASTGAGALGVALKPGGWSWEVHAFVHRLPEQPGVTS